MPRYVRVNTLKMSTRKAITILRESIKDVRYSSSMLNVFTFLSLNSFSLHFNEKVNLMIVFDSEYPIQLS